MKTLTKALNSHKGTQDKKFARLSKKRKRIAIAEDVIAQLRIGFLNAEQGIYVSSGGIDKSDARNDLQSELNKEGVACDVCALGALFTCDVLKMNSCNVEILEDSDGMREKLDYFSLEQLELIECAFEMAIISNECKLLEIKSMGSYGEDIYKPTKLAKKAIRFGRRHKNDDEKRMKSIMKNIIRNDGAFIP